MAGNESNRLIEYLAVIGVKKPDGNAKQVPVLLNRFPKKDYPDYAFSNDVCYFCQPEGCNNVCRRSNQILHEDTSSFVFTLTEKDSGYVRYGICVNFYRPFEKKDLEKLKIKSKKKSKSQSVNSSQKSSISSDEEEYLEKSSRANSDLVSDGSSKDTKIPNGDAYTSSPQRHKLKSARTHTLTSLCIISYHPFISTFRRCLLTLKRLIEACYQRTNVKNGKGSKNLESIWGLLCGSVCNNVPGVAVHDMREIESWIASLISCPIPVAGKHKVTLELLPTSMQIPSVIAFPDPTRLSLLDFPLHLPLELLGIDLCLQALTAILLEQKVVLVSKNYNALSMSIMALTSMLYPLQYMFPVIPLLPQSMPGSEQLLLAPTPYIIGLPSSFFDQKHQFRFPFDVWKIDLDANKMIKPSNGDKLPRLPEPEAATLKARLKQALAGMSLNPPIQDLQNFLYQDAAAWLRTKTSSIRSKTNSQTIFGEDVDTVDVATRVAMVRFLFSPNTLQYYTDHTRTLRLYPRPVVAFQQQSFMQSRDKPTEFAFLLSRTQAVEFLGEWTLAPDNVAFLRITNEVFDPQLIGDKPKWFADQLANVCHSTHEQCSSLVATVTMVDELISRTNSDEPTDESGSDSDPLSDDTATSYSSYSEEEELTGISKASNENKEEENGDGNNNKAKTILSKDDDVISDKVSDVKTNSLQLSTPNSVENERSKSAKIDRKTPFPSMKGPRKTLIDHRSVVRHGSPLPSTPPSRPSNQPSPATSTATHSNTKENQQFLKGITHSVLEGNGVGWFNLKKIRRLMESESLRLFLLQRLNQSTQKEGNNDHVEDVEISIKVYRGLLDLLKCALSGLEQTFNVRHGLGGMASAFLLLEICHTHYYAKELKGQDKDSLRGNRDLVAPPDFATLASVPDEVAEDTPSVHEDTCSIASAPECIASSKNDSHLTKDNVSVKSVPARLSEDIDNSASSATESLIGTGEIRYRNGRLIRVESDFGDDEERVFLYQGLLGKDRSSIWDEMQFWEDAFLDAVAMERDAVGMDQGPTDMIERYRALGASEKKRLEEDEDRLLSTLLYNLVSHMVMMAVKKSDIKRKVRRLLGKSHVGLSHSTEVNRLLEDIDSLNEGIIDLKPCGSRHIRKQSFVVHSGTDTSGDIYFMEVCDDAIILRTGFGTICERWWYEKLVNMTFCPKTRVVCLWHRKGSQTALNKFYTKKSRELYHCIREAMEKAASRYSEPEIGGEYPIQDMKTGQSGLLQVTLDGINLKFASSQVFLGIRTIRKCNNIDGIFILEEYNRATDEVTIHKYKSSLAAEINYAVLCLFSYIAAARRAER